MSDLLIAALFLGLSSVFGWMLVDEYRRGRAELPRTGWVVDRRFDPALFWTFTGCNGLILAMLVFASVMLLLR